MPSPLLKKKTLVAVATETTELTAISSLTTSNVHFLADEVTYNPDFTIIPRNFASSSFARKAPRVTLKLARITFKIELRGSGTVDVAPKWARLLYACGFSEAITASNRVTWTSVVPHNQTYWDGTGAATGNSALTIWVFRDGKVYKAKHCRGNFRVTGEAAGIAYLEFEFLGVYTDPADVTYPVPAAANMDSTTPPLIASCGFTFQDVTTGNVIFRSGTLNCGNQVQQRYSAIDPDGFHGMLITDRETTFEFDPEDVILGATGWQSKDVLKRFSDGTTGAFNYSIGTVAGNRLAFAPGSGGFCQLTQVSEGDRDEMTIQNVTVGFFVPDDTAPPGLTIVHD